MNAHGRTTNARSPLGASSAESRRPTPAPLDPSRVDELVRRVQDPSASPRERNGAAMELADHQTPQAWQVLSGLLESEAGYPGRALLVEALAHYSGVDVAPILMRVLREDAEGDCRSAAARGLADRLNEANVLGALATAAVEDSHRYVRRAAIIALGSAVPKGEAMEALRAAAERDSEAENRALASRAMNQPERR